MCDSAGVTAGFSLSDWLPSVSFGSLPEGMHDAGQMSVEEIRRFLSASNI